MSKKPSPAGSTGRKRKQEPAGEAPKAAVVVEEQLAASSNDDVKEERASRPVESTESITIETPKASKAPQQKHASQVAPVPPPVPQFVMPESAPQQMQGMHIRISKELQSKLKMQAEEEGIGLHEYIAELLAEGAVLRAWEIVERKAQMRGGSPNHQQQHQHGGGNPNHRGGNAGNSGGRRNDRFNNNNSNNNNRRMSSNRYQSIMDDKASFLEYVRSQERQGR